MQRRRLRGVTLIELMAVVAIVGVLAALAVVGYRRYINSAKTGQTRDLLVHIATQQQRYYAQTRGYLSCSADYLDYYPSAPGSKKRQFHNTGHLDYECWRVFAVDSEAATYAAFITIAVAPGVAIVEPPTKQKIGLPPYLDRPWFIVYAAADQDEDNNLEMLYTSSFAPSDVHIENPGD